MARTLWHFGASSHHTDPSVVGAGLEKGQLAICPDRNLNFGEEHKLGWEHEYGNFVGKKPLADYIWPNGIVMPITVFVTPNNSTHQGYFAQPGIHETYHTHSRFPDLVSTLSHSPTVGYSCTWYLWLLN
jgi:hypothetical protein